MLINMKITIIQTGGSIDKEYPRVLRSYAFEIGTPAIRRILKGASANLSYRVISLFRKDSLDITDADRNKIRRTCLRIKNSKIIITHGTDTMIETAKLLTDIPGKVIIITGAIQPYSCIESDAAFNVGTAIGALHHLSEGVYIAMNARIYLWNACVKDLNCRFVEK